MKKVRIKRRDKTQKGKRKTKLSKKFNNKRK